MPLNVAVQMDHISTISIAGDTSFALMLEAGRRGHRLFHYTPDRLTMRGNEVFAAIEEVSVRDEKGNFPPDSINGLVAARLSELSEKLRRGGAVYIARDGEFLAGSPGHGG